MIIQPAADMTWDRETMPQWAKDHEAMKNAQILRPLTLKGRWIQFEPDEPFSWWHEGTIVCRTLRFTGIKGGYATYEGADFWRWDSRLTA